MYGWAEGLLATADHARFLRVGCHYDSRDDLRMFADCNPDTNPTGDGDAGAQPDIGCSDVHAVAHRYPCCLTND